MNFIGEQFAIWNALAWGGGEPSCADAYIWEKGGNEILWNKLFAVVPSFCWEMLKGGFKDRLVLVLKEKCPKSIGGETNHD